jgi:Cof subfamily protein (haloacid dehalogenase superfamily)
VRLVAIDVDGTLLTSGGEVTSATRTAIAAAQAAGVEVVLASSRGARVLKRLLRRLELLDPAEFIAAQGALVGALASDGVLRVTHEAAIPLASAHELVALADEAGFSTNWFRGLDWFVPQMTPVIEAESVAVGERPTVRDLFAVTRAPEKLMLIAEPESVHRLETLAANLPAGLTAQTSGPTYLEITRSGVDKGSALSRLCTRRGIRAAEVVAIGDGRNDLGMFDFAGTSVAMANAPASVRERSTRITRSNDEDGVAVALNELLAAS